MFSIIFKSNTPLEVINVNDIYIKIKCCSIRTALIFIKEEDATVVIF